jgi:hypothetical protein
MKRGQIDISENQQLVFADFDCNDSLASKSIYTAEFRNVSFSFVPVTMSVN